MTLWMPYLKQARKNIMHNLSANNFKLAPEAYSKAFKDILAGIVKCYKIMLKDKARVPGNDENKIRDIILKKYLNNNSIRKKVDLTNYLFEGEPIERQGFVDIKISTNNTFNDTNAYYIVECKRLDDKNLEGVSGLNAKYIENGILRFTTGKYSTYCGLNGMIGFVVKPLDISSNIKNINNLLRGTKFRKANTITDLKPNNFIKNFNHSYLSTHKPNNKAIDIYHLMFDFSKNTTICPIFKPLKKIITKS